MKKSVLITGQAGFIGTHLANYLTFVANDYEIIPIQDENFYDPQCLNSLCAKADFIVHLAGVNRHHNPDELYDTNIDLTNGNPMLAAI